MNINDLRPIHDLVKRYGVKVILYGGPGMGKTPILATSPGVCMAFAETSLLSIRNSTFPGYITDTYERMRDFWKWATTSHEARQFSSFGGDSLTQMCEIVLEQEKKANKDGRKAYGAMAEKITEILHWTFYTENFNVIFTAKEEKAALPDGAVKYQPYFPGNMVPIEVNHLFDSIWRLEWFTDAQGVSHKVIRTRDNLAAFARNRLIKMDGTPSLDELEYADITHLITKSLAT